MRTVGKISPAKGKVHLSYLVKEMGILLLYIIFNKYNIRALFTSQLFLSSVSRL